MKLLIDECLPRALKRLFGDHTCRTVQEMGWARKKNGLLLSLAETEFDVLITMDQGFEHQQNLMDRRIALLLLVAAFRGEYSVPLQRPFHWDTWAVAGILCLLFAAILSLRSYSKLQPHI